MKQIGIIGTGIHGSRYANHIVHDISGLNLAGISRRSLVGREQAENWQTRYFADWRTLVNDPDIEAVIAVTPPSQNLDIARECAGIGKSLLMEKPLARNSIETAEIVSMFEGSPGSLTVGQTLRYNPVISSLEKELPAMGQLYSFAVNQRIEPSALAWHDDPVAAGAGVIIHTAVHVFDALRKITGLRITRVMAAARCVHSNHLDDLVTVLVECEGGVLGTVDVSKVGKARSGRFEFICQNGQLHGEQIHGFTSVIENNTVVRHMEFSPHPAILPLLSDWHDFLHGLSQNPIPGEDGHYAVAVCDACLHSAKERCWVTVPESDGHSEGLL